MAHNLVVNYGLDKKMDMLVGSMRALLDQLQQSTDLRFASLSRDRLEQRLTR